MSRVARRVSECQVLAVQFNLGDFTLCRNCARCAAGSSVQPSPLSRGIGAFGKYLSFGRKSPDLSQQSGRSCLRTSERQRAFSPLSISESFGAIKPSRSSVLFLSVSKKMGSGSAEKRDSTSLIMHFHDAREVRADPVAKIRLPF